MKIKEGGVMDIEKERKLFLAYMRSIEAAGFMFELDEDGNFDDMSMCYAWEAWQAAKDDAVSELTDKMIVAIESEVESQLKASAIDADPFRLDGEKIWYAAVEAQEPAND